jgi:dynein assembly factor 2, axonemal
MSLKDWEKLDISSEEVNKIGEALKNEEFRKMFVDYCEEITDPENRKLYESDIIQLEKERGVKVTFVNPTPGYVLKTSSDGCIKTFINIATNENIDKPSSSPAADSNGVRGLNWQLPYSLSPPRRDMDKKRKVCHVYDVIFNPEALHLASKNIAFRSLVNDTAINAIQNTFKVTLDQANIRFPKISYKGFAKSTVIRKKISDFKSTEEASPIENLLPPTPDENKCTTTLSIPNKMEEYTTPKYKIVQRKGIEFFEMTNELDAKLNSTIPSEIVVTIELPMLNTSQDASIDVTKKRLILYSEKPAKYRLDIPLPYEVSEEKGNAKFDKTKRQLIITLPVVPDKKLRMIDVFSREDSGIESDQTMSYEKNEHEVNHGNDSPSELSKMKEEEVDFSKTSDNILPNFTFNQIDEIMAFTLHVKNVDASSIIVSRQDYKNLAYIRFSSISSGYYPQHYSFCVKFPKTDSCIFKEITAEAWDNNVIFQFELNDFNFDVYETGIDENSLTIYSIAHLSSTKSLINNHCQKIEDDSLSIEIHHEKVSELVIEVNRKDSRSEISDVSEDVFDDKPKECLKRQTKRKRGGKKIRSLSESYCDELKVINEMDSLKLDDNEKKIKQLKQRSISESSDEHQIVNQIPIQNKYKSILKNRSSFSECHESSIEDHSNKNFYSVSGEFGFCQSHESLSESCKKTVRFSDMVKRQLFR